MVSNNPNVGKPKEESLPTAVQLTNYDQVFFLALAAKGKDVWNAWRRDPANVNVEVTFAGVDFSKEPNDRIDFSGFEFGDFPTFAGCMWRSLGWREVERDPKAFKRGRASFVGATFGSQAFFAGVVFGNYANFAGAVFGFQAIFNGASFGSFATFEGASFGESTSFTMIAFGQDPRFDSAHFKGNVTFGGGRKELWEENVLPNVDKNEEVRFILKKRHEESWQVNKSGPDRLGSASFVKTRFDGPAHFVGRSNNPFLDFTNARFYSPPIFDALIDITRTDFSGAYIGFARPGRWHWTKDSNIPVRLRALRRIAEETKNHDLERDLFIEERKAERGVYLHLRWEGLKKSPILEKARVFPQLLVHFSWIVVMLGYWALADYGRSFARPVAWFATSVFIFHLWYVSILEPFKQRAGPTNAVQYEAAERMLAFSNAVPFISSGIFDTELKKFLFCAGDISEACTPLRPVLFQLLVMVQGVVSIVFFFFIGLALRNYFKIR
jgi:hypothetical protein